MRSPGFSFLLFGLSFGMGTVCISFQDCFRYIYIYIYIYYNRHKLWSIHPLGSRFGVAPAPQSAPLPPLTQSLPSTLSMAPKRAVAKRPLQRNGATRRAAELAEVLRAAADAERAAAMAAHLEAERVAFVEAQRIAIEEAARHDAELRREAAGHEARRAALLDVGPKRRPPTPPP